RHHTVIENGHSVIPAEHHVEAFLTDRAIAYLQDQAASGKPFCLGVSYFGPHRPMTPPEPWDRMYDPASLPLPASVNDPMTRAPRSHREFHWRMYGIDLPHERERLKRQLVFEGEMWDLLDRPAWTQREYRELMAHYYGYISYIDAQIGRLLDALDRLGLARNTLVLYTSDHGEYMAAHGCIFKSMAMYDDLIRVPLILRLPGRVPSGRVTQALTSSVDLMPTLLDFAGLSAPDSVHGVSLRPVAEGRTEDHHDAVFTSFPAPAVQMRMVRTDRYKYSFNWSPRQQNELYDLVKDPGEMRNLADLPETRAVQERHHRLVVRQMQRIRDPWRHKALAIARLAPLTSLVFAFDQRHEIEYWDFYRGITEARIEDGKLRAHITCPGYMVAQFSEPVRGDDYPVLEIIMSATAGDAAQVYWSTQDEPRMDEKKSVRFEIQADGKLHTYRLELGKHDRWRGKLITHFRLNPVRTKGAEADFEIDYIGPPR
ncbi:MAG: sulfatase-like hydrolase/transferase, partial [Armatimonadetes bacterium]|nr:sulfatase-like hydrolase/transferase [Armatimonadota bacterium]